MPNKYKTIDIVNLDPEWKYHFLFSVMSEAAERRKKDITVLFSLDGVSLPEEIDVKVSINGVEVDYEDFISQMESQLERIINDRAAKLLQNCATEKMEKIRDALGKIDNNLNDLIKDVLPAWETSSHNC